MKRILFALVWFVALAFGGLVAGGAIAGALAGAKVKSTGFTDAVAQGEQVGHEAGTRFGEEHGGKVFLGALVIAIVGSVAGILPGTKRKPPKEEE